MKNLLNSYRQAGFKLTPQRMEIIKYLDGNKEHPSAEDIYRSIREKFPTMSFATVYNTLEMLAQKGEVIKLSIDPDKARFDPDSSPHHHLICTGCSRIVDIFEDYGLQPAKAGTEGFVLTGHHVEFYGTCPDCGEKDPAKVTKRKNDAHEKEGSHEKKRK